MASITVFGTGNMGNALREMLEAGETTIRHVGRDHVGALEDDIVILAVPYESIDEIVEEYGDQLDGRIVVDITNPVDFETFDSLKVSPDGSAAAELQSAVPGARVVKAFNTNFAGTLSSGSVGTHRTTVLVAGDDADAKQAVIDLVEAADVQAIDAGSLARARELEAIGFLQIALANAEKIDWSAGFGVFAR